MTVCGAVGALTVGGRVVGRISCELEAGHDADQHAVTLTWAPEADPDLDLFDPDEHFDVVVEI